MLREKATARRMGWTSPCRSAASPSPSTAVVDFSNRFCSPFQQPVIFTASSRFSLVVFVGDLFLECLGDVLFVHGQHEHLVVGEQAFADGFAETKAVEFLAEEGLIVHRRQFGGGFLGLGLGLVAVDARRGGHVEALFGFEEIRVVDFDEAGFVFARKRDAGGAVGFVANDQVEVG